MSKQRAILLVQKYLSQDSVEEALQTIINWASENGNNEIETEGRVLLGDLQALNRKKVLRMISLPDLELAERSLKANAEILGSKITEHHHTMNTSLKSHLNKLIRNAREKEALDLLLDWSERHDTSLNSDAVLLSARLTRLQREMDQGTIEAGNAKVFLAQITNTLRALVEQVPDGAAVELGVNPFEVPPPTPPPPPPIKHTQILMLTSNPSGGAKLNLDKEYARISEKLQHERQRFNLVVERAVNRNEFKELPERYKPQILHFSGHGEGGELGGIMVQNDDKNGHVYITPKALGALFDYYNRHKLNIQGVVLNACYSEEQALAISKHVPYVVATTVDIGDTLAIAFSTGFYFKLAESEALDFEKAFDSGRLEAILEGASESHFVLYYNGQKLEI
ncbi:MAG TPA: hypothetical protein VK168_20125 [Saprospiraceae bacterium]|nr:hypothetical protein [Saprospiraceae bacterium]